MPSLRRALELAVLAIPAALILAAVHGWIWADRILGGEEDENEDV